MLFCIAMSSMLRDVNQTGTKVHNLDALKSEIRRVLINQKVNACPIAMRMAWHASGIVFLSSVVFSPLFRYP